MFRCFPAPTQKTFLTYMILSFHIVYSVFNSYLILCLLMSSMVKEEYSLSSWGSCCDWLLVRMPYIGTDTNWI